MTESYVQAMTEPEPSTGSDACAPRLLRLVESARRGNREEADRLYAEVRPRLLRIALALGADPDGASDAVQECLWSAHRNLHRFDPERASFPGWLSVILVRRLRNRRRADARRSRLLEALRLSPARAEAGPQRVVEARLTLARLLQALTARQREVVALYEIGELDAAEAARALDLTPAGVRSIARDARRKLSQAASGAAEGCGEEGDDRPS
jgi:RNA polymerase sigma-70 factor (ECF subfamily)